jgi:cysteine desulfurase
LDEIYFDNAATTKPSRQALEAAADINDMYYANPSSSHAAGIAAERALKKAAETISDILDVSPGEILFTSGGTESNNIAVFGQNPKSRFITDRAEHPSVLVPAERLKAEGRDVVFLPIDEGGAVDVGALEEALYGTSGAVVSVMHINNETGVIQDIAEIGRITKRYDALFHVDGVQGFGKHRLSLKDVDTYSVSAHKIHGLKGVGALFARKGVFLRPLFYGGAQQGAVRPGTENTAGAAAFAAAALDSFLRLAENERCVNSVKSVLLDGLSAVETRVNGENTSPYIANVSFLGVKAETLLNALSQKGIYVSTGAACNAKKSKANILTHYGLPEAVTGSAVRFSFSPDNTTEEAARCAETAAETAAFLRKFQPV